MSLAMGLKLVPVAVPEDDDLTGYSPQFLSSKALLDAYWVQTEAVLRPVVEEAMHGEMTTQDIYDRIISGQMYCIVIQDGSGELPKVALAIVMEIVVYPRLTALNITALGGRQLNLLKSRFWGHLCSWAYMNGVRCIQAMVSPAMARVISRYGFEPVYTVMRLPLTEM